MSAQALLIVAGGVLLLLSSVILVRMRLLSIRYGVGWTMLALSGILGAPLLEVLSRRVHDLGFTPTGFSLGVLIVFLGMICLQLSMTASGLGQAVQDLSEYSALLEQRVRDLERDGDDIPQPDDAS